VVPGTTAGTGVIRLAWPDLGDEELAAVAEVFESGQLTMGPKVAEFEAGLAAACEVEHAVAVSSGTAALHLAVLGLGIGPGDEVIVPAYTFPATANVVVMAGAKPVLVDVDPETMNVRPEAVAEAVTERTQAVLVVHLFGRPARWEEIAAGVPERVQLLEDAAGALGARRAGRACGGLGRLGCLSFHPRKIVTTGEGGAVTTNDEELAETIRSMRNHGWRGTDMPAPGVNYRLPDILSAVGSSQLGRLGALLEERERLAAAYTERLEGVVRTPTADPGDRHGLQAYVVQLDGRDEALDALREAGIQAQIGTYALHRLSAYRDQGNFPGADAAYARALALPFHNRLGEGEIDHVTSVLTSVVSE
jgi:perosamine synthetase